MDRQDKLVIMAGVVILIISVIGIVYHEKNYVASEKIKEEKSYIVTWRDYSDELTDSGYVGRDGWQGNYEIKLQDTAHIYEVEIKVDWSDNLDFHGFILPWNWSDRMELSASIDEMGFSDTASGYNGIDIHAEKNKLNDFTSKAGSREDVLKQVEGMVTNDINCSLSLSISPKPMFLDRGNDFTVHIIYHYLKPEIKEQS